MGFFARFRAAWRAAAAPDQPSTGADNTVNDVADQATSVQARDIDALTVDRSADYHGTVHQGGTTITGNTGPVHIGDGDQYTDSTVIRQNEGIVNLGGTNTYHGPTVVGGGSVTNVNNGGRVGVQLGNVSGGTFTVGFNTGHVTQTDTVNGGMHFGG
ncbi:hypothetical protein SAMN05421803_1521, partial [Nocardiopsis flavescens]